MKIKTLVLLTALFSTVMLFAQEEQPKPAVKYANITEFGFFAASPKSVYGEGTTVHGICVNKQHAIGLGIGIGGGGYFGKPHSIGTAYMPVFLNYRIYFLPNKKLSPHINVAAGGLITTHEEGFYSSLTVGFRSGKFSFSSGFSCLPINDKDYGWYFPIGITIKVGFTL